jgi:hypothetical protein
MGIMSWVKSNKLAVVLVLLILFLFSKNFFDAVSPISQTSFSGGGTNFGATESSAVGRDAIAPAAGLSQKSLSFPPAEPDYAPNADVSNRLVIQESYLSLLVKDVTDVREKIIAYAQANGGYMVNTSINNPQDAPTATVIVRIPSTKLNDALRTYRELGVKVVNENLVGTDVTDQYVDIDARIGQLENTKAKLEEILERATTISDITNLTQQILSYQSQIDSYKGQQESLSKNADLAKLTMYLSTDEIALPYTPSETFRPSVIFKLAVRSMVSSLRDVAEWAIWIGVYGVIWVPLLVIYVVLKKWWKNRASNEEA